MLQVSKAPIRFLAIFLLAAAFLTGCARSTPETKPPEPSRTVGVMDMDKAIKAHPKYQDWQKLKQQAITIKEQLNVAAASQAAAALPGAQIAMPANIADSVKAAMEQEFNAKMVAKQKELEANWAQSANKVHSELSAALGAYARELDEQYQPQLFNLQLKLQTVRMDEKEAAEVKKAMDALKAEQAAKMAAKEKELLGQMETALAPQKAAMEEQLAAYAKELNTELAGKLSAQTAAAPAQLPPAVAEPEKNSASSSLSKDLGMKQQEINVLEEYILNDIRDKAAKVAVERNLSTVLTGHVLNLQAVDVTDAVIAAFKK